MSDEIFDSVEDHLRTEAAEGRQVDDGVFTIKTATALKKLRTHGLENPEFWVLKVLQAAVACGATSIDYTFERKVVKITFQNASEWSGDRILEAFEAGPSESDRALSHLQMGLLVALGQGQNTLAWTCGGRRTILEGQQSAQDHFEDDGQVHLALKRRNDSSSADVFRAPIRHLFKQTAAEYKALIERARYSPIPVTIDGYKLPRRYARNAKELPLRSGVTDPSELIASLLALTSVQSLPLKETLEFPLAELEFHHSSQWCIAPESLQTQNWKPDPGPIQGVLSLFYSSTRAHEVTFLMDGVWLERVKLRDLLGGRQESVKLLASLNQSEDYGFALGLDLPVGPEQVDISQFKVRKDFVGQLIPDLKPKVVSLLKGVAEACDLPWDFEDLPEVSAGFEDTAVGDIVDWGVIALVSPFIVAGCLLLPFFGVLGQGGALQRSAELKVQIEETLSRLAQADENQEDF